MKIIDPETQEGLNALKSSSKWDQNVVPNVRTVLVILSAAAIVYDVESLRQKILMSYPDAAVFFQTTSGKALGSAAPKTVDLLIDFTGPGQRQGFLHAKKLRRIARVAVGRNAGLFRKNIYDKVFDEKAQKNMIPSDVLKRERLVQREVMALAGVAIVPTAEVTEDKGKSIALELPPLQRR